VNRYNDPSWYEKQEADQSSSIQPAHNGVNPYFEFPADNTLQQEPIEQSSSPQQKRRIRRWFGPALAIAALVVIAFISGWYCHQLFGSPPAPSADSKKYEQLFDQAWSTVDQNYVDRKAVDYKKMSYAAIQAMVDSLNDTGHTRFLKPEDVRAENQQLSGKFTGIGIYLHQDQTTKQLIISSTIPGAPAEKAGFKRGDIIVSVNGVSTAGKDISGVSSLIQGKEGTSVSITVRRSGVGLLTISVMRAQIQVPNVIMHYIPESHIADIQIVQFADGVTSQLQEAVNKAKAEGATKIILDLRDNPGGFLNEAVDTTSLFVKSGNVLLEQDSSGRRSPVSVHGFPLDTNIPIVVLVNENSASAAEIVSGALQDNHRAIIIGSPHTFGTGTVLQQFNLDDGSAILLGTQEWLTPNGQFIRGQGIKPNIVVTQPANATMLTPNDENVGNMTQQQILNSGDAQLTAAIQYLQQH
jgi:carboxyl-terminal processing protease